MVPFPMNSYSNW